MKVQIEGPLSLDEVNDVFSCTETQAYLETREILRLPSLHPQECQGSSLQAIF
jgi:hypothetical protein